MTLDFSTVASNKKATKKEKTKVVMLTPTAPRIEPIQKELDQYKPKLKELESQAKDLKVIDNETFQLSVDGAGTAKGLIKAIDGRRAEVTVSFREFINKVNNAAKFFTDPFKRIAEEFSRKGGDYQYQLQLAEKKRQKAIDEANAKLQEKLDKQAKEDGVEAVTVIPVKAPKPETTIHTAGGHSQHLRKQWVGEIEDPIILQKMLRAFLIDVEEGKVTTKTKMISKLTEILFVAEHYIREQKLINDAVRMGIREIPGVKIFEKVSAVHR